MDGINALLHCLDEARSGIAIKFPRVHERPVKAMVWQHLTCINHQNHTFHMIFYMNSW